MSNTIRSFSLFLILAAACGPNTEHNKTELSFKTDDIIAIAEENYTEATRSLQFNGRMPRNANPDGTWKTVPLKDWTSGFFPGVLWQLYEYTGKDYWK